MIGCDVVMLSSITEDLRADCDQSRPALTLAFYQLIGSVQRQVMRHVTQLSLCHYTLHMMETGT